ncbi:MAG TPA: aldo/keto reductase [Planctomycetota bacterium]|nr:aldo/keto reductase [Planctomycetota bacterium]
MSLKTYNQIALPSFLYGTAWKKDATSRLVELAVESGFTAIDTANQLVHYHEALVGDALLALQKKGIGRDRLFLQTKFTSVDGQRGNTPYDASADLPTQVRQSFESSLSHLHTDRLDSYVLHGPYYRNRLGGEDWEVWSAIEQLFRAGKTRIIGISNVSAVQLTELCAKAEIKPMVVQNRCYAALGWDRDVRQICRDHQIIYEGFSLLTANPEVFGDPRFRAIAKRVNAGLPQVVFRFAQQVGMLPLTGTTSAQHMKEDLACEEFTLTPEEVRVIETIAVG